MANGKSVTIYTPGRTSSDAVPIMPGDTVDMILNQAITRFKLPPPTAQLFYQLTKGTKVLVGDLYNSVQNGDELEMQRIEKGGGGFH